MAEELFQEPDHKLTGITRKRSIFCNSDLNLFIFCKLNIIINY